MTLGYKTQVHISAIKVTCFLIISLMMLTGCRPSASDPQGLDYTPIHRDDWEVSTPEVEGLDPKLVAKLYKNASKLDTVFSVLVIKKWQVDCGGIFQ